MPRIHCKLPNASTNINGVAFEPHPQGGMISEEIDDERAAHFASIKGYKVVREINKGGRPRKDAGKQDDDKTDDQTGDGQGDGEKTPAPDAQTGDQTNTSTDTGASGEQSGAQSNQ